MKIINGKKNLDVKFSQVPVGNVFRWEDELYINIKTTVNLNSISLSDYSLASFNYDTIVTLVDSELHIF